MNLNFNNYKYYFFVFILICFIFSFDKYSHLQKSSEEPDDRIKLEKNKKQEASNSYLSFMELLQYAWTLKPIEKEGSRSIEDLKIKKKEVFKLLYKKYAFTESGDLSFEKDYTFEKYINELEEDLIKMNKAEFYPRIQNQTKHFTIHGIVSIIKNTEKEQFIFFSKKDISGIAKGRIILNLKPEYVLKMLDFIKENFDNQIKGFKMTTYKSFNKRRDNFIIYVSSLDFANQYLEKIHSHFLNKYPNSFNQSVPYMTNKIHDGMAVAEEPSVDNESVGTIRCRLIMKSLFETKGDFNDFTEQVFTNFETNGLDFFTPHKNLN